MYIYCLAHVLLAYYPPAPPGLPPLCPIMPELCHLDKGKYKHNAKKQTQIGRLLHWHYLLFILCYNVHLRPIKIGEAYLITPGRPLALALDLKRQQWPTTSGQRTKGCNCRGEITFVLRRQSLKDGWSTDTHIFIDKTMAGSLFIWDSLSVSAHLGSCFVPDSHLFPFTQMWKWEICLDIFFK